MRPLRPGIVIAALGVAAGCGSSDGLPADRFVDQVDTANCALLVRCHVFSEPAFCPAYFGPTDTGFNSLSAVVAEVKAGHTRYDAAAARRCVNALGAASCDDLTSSGIIPAACQPVFAGTLQDGSPCTADAACLAGSFCAPPASGNGCGGTCVRGGTQCNEDSQCTDGRVCDTQMHTGAGNGTCVTPVPPGAENAPCGTKGRCAAGLICGPENLCVRLNRAGEPCLQGLFLGGCADGLSCVVHDDNASSSCLAIVKKGESCQASRQCGGFLSTLVCDAVTRLCVDAPVTGPCAGPTLACNPLSAYCDAAETPPTCKPYLATGATCSPVSSACGLPGTARCQPTGSVPPTGTCAPTPPGRESCVPGSGPDGGGTPSPDSGTPPGSAPATAGEACQRLNEASAQLAARCQGGSIADWRANWAISQDCAAFDRHVAEGLVEYRPEGWDACLAKYALPCLEANPYPCYFEILHGKVPDGQPCKDTEVCGTVSGCISLTGAACSDMCVRFGNENEACGVYCGGSVPCLDFAACTSGLFCQAGTCVKGMGNGLACGGPDGVACGFGLFCSSDPGDPEGNGTCVPLFPGAFCHDNTGCPPNEFCLATDPDPLAPGTCTARRPLQASCADVADSCVAWATCDPNGSQRCVSAGHIGEPCGPFPSAAFSCVIGTCDGTQCVPIATQGGSCMTAACAQGASCDPNTTTCMACAP